MQLFKKKKSVLGLDLGSHSTKVVELVFNGTDKPSLERCDLVETGLDSAEFTGNIKEYFRQNKLTSAMVASSIDDPSMKIRKMELPKMPDLELLEAIRWNLRDIVEGNIDDFTVNYSRIAESDENDVQKIELMAYAINRQAVVDYTTKIQMLGLVPFFIEPAAVTLATVLERCTQDESNYISLAHIGYKQSLFVVIGKGVLVFSRPLMGITLEQFDREKDTFKQKLAIEIQKSIDTFKVNFKMEDIYHLYVSGGGGLIAGLTDYLAVNLGLTSNLLDPFVSLSNTEQFADRHSQLFAQAVGLALLQP